MAPAVGSTEMRYCGISLFRRFASATPALWPAVPTGGVPQRMSCCDQAAEADIPITAATATAAIVLLSMVLPSNGPSSRHDGCSLAAPGEVDEPSVNSGL